MTWIHLKRSEGAVVNSGKILKQEVERMIGAGQRVSDKFVLEFVKRRFNKTVIEANPELRECNIYYKNYHCNLSMFLENNLGALCPSRQATCD